MKLSKKDKILLVVLGLIVVGMIGNWLSPEEKRRPMPGPEAPKVPMSEYKAWLESTVSELEGAFKNLGVSASVLEAIFPNDDIKIVWIRTFGLPQGSAESLCRYVAKSYVRRFSQGVVVHFYGPAGIQEPLERCVETR